MVQRVRRDYVPYDVWEKQGISSRIRRRLTARWQRLWRLTGRYGTEEVQGVCMTCMTREGFWCFNLVWIVVY